MTIKPFMVVVGGSHSGLKHERRAVRLVEARPGTPLRTMYLAAMESVHGSDLRYTLRSSRPRFVIDMRSSRRFDAPGINREIFFEIIHTTGSEYVRISYPATYRDNIGLDSLMDYVRSSEGDIIILLPKKNDVARLVESARSLLEKMRDSSWIMHSML